MFNLNTQTFNYDDIIEQINIKLLSGYLDIIKKRLLNLSIPRTDEEVIDLDNLIIFLKEDRTGLRLSKWGGTSNFEAYTETAFSCTFSYR